MSYCICQQQRCQAVTKLYLSGCVCVLKQFSWKVNSALDKATVAFEIVLSRGKDFKAELNQCEYNDYDDSSSDDDDNDYEIDED